MIVVSLIQNIAMLVMLAALYQVVEAHGGGGLLRRKALVGVLFGVVAVLGMMAPVRFAPGIIFDGRSIILSLAGLLGGPVAGLISAAICGGYRLWLGGGGAAMGVSVAVESALVGVLFRYLRRRGKWPSELAGLAAMAWLVHGLMLGLTLLLPAEERPRVWRQLGPAILTVYPAVTVLLGMLFLDYERQTGARAALAASEQRYRSTLASIGDAVIATNARGEVEFMNPVAEALTGWPLAEARGQPLETVFPILNEFTRQPVENPVARVLREGHVVGLANHTLLRARDGTERPIADSGAPIRDESGAVTGVVLTFRDQSAERAAQRALRESEEKFRILSEDSLTPVYVIQDGRFRYVNEAEARLLGYSREELLALPSVLETVAQEDRPRVLENIQRRLGGQGGAMQYEFTFVRKDGKRRLVEVVGAATTFEGRPAVLGTARDVTERRRAEEALRISEARLREAQRVAHVGSWECEVVSTEDLSCNHLWWSDETYRLLGFEPQTVEPTHDLFLSRVHPEDRSRVRAAFVEALHTGQPYQIEHRVLLPDGTERILLEHAEPLEDEPDRPRRLIGAVQDVTELRRAAAELEQNHQCYRAAIEAAGGIPYQKDYASDSYIFMGAGIKELLGYEPSELSSAVWREIILETEMLGEAAGLAPAEAARRAVRGELKRWRADHRVRTRSGQIRWISDTSISLLDAGGRYIGSLGMIQDITERKRGEEERREALERRRAEAEVVARVASSPYLFNGQVAELAAELTQQAAPALRVERVGVWLFDPSGKQLTSVDNYVASTGTHTSGEVLPEEEFHNEFEALRQARYVDAHDALADPRTAGYVEGYLKPHGITSMLDVAIRMEGRTLGLLCFEHVGPPRRWNQEEIAFACQLADQMALALLHRERLQAQEALRRQEQDYREVFNATNEAIFIDDAATGRILDVNETMLRMYGYDSKEEVLGGNIGDLSANEPPYTEDEAQRRIRLAIEQRPQTFEWLARRKNGERFWVEVSLHSALIGGQQRVLAVVRDITERKQAEAALRQSEERLRLAQSAAHVGIWDYDFATQRAVWTPEQEALFGLPPGSYDGTDAMFQRLVHPEDRPRLAETLARALETGTFEIELRVLWPDGQVRWLAGHGQVHYDATGRPVRMLGVNFDITQRKQAEAALAESETRFRSLYENALMGLYRTTPDGRILLANPALVRMLGYTSFQELAQQNLEKEGFHPSYPRQAFKEAIERDGVVYGLESAWTRADGSTVYVRESARAVRDPQGNVLYYDGVVEDITERKKAEAALAESEERYRLLVEQSPDGIGIYQDDRLVYINTTGLKAFGAKSPTELLGRTVGEFIHPDDLQAARQRIERLFAGEETDYPAEVRYCRPDGTILPVEVSAVRISYQGRPAIQFVVRDITERKQAEAALAESEARFRMLTEATTAGVIVYQGNRLRFTNPAVSRLTGYTEQELLNMDVYDLVAPEQRELVRQRGAARQRGEPVPNRYEIKLVTKDGQSRWVDFSAGLVLFDGQPAGLGTVVDITERKQAEEARQALLTLATALTEAQSKADVARSIFAAADRLWHWDSGALHVLWPGESRVDIVLCVDTIQGARREVPPGGTSSEPTPRVRRVMANGAELILRTPAEMKASDSEVFGDTTRLSASIMAVPVRVRGRAVGVLSIQSYTPNAFDEADLRTLEGLADYCGGALERIRAHEHIHRQAQLLDAAAEAIWVRALDDRIIYWNRGAEQLYGWSATEALGHKFTDLQGLDTVAYQTAHAALLRDGHWAGELTRTAPGGHSQVAFCRWTLLRDAAGQPAEVLAIHADITEQKQLEANFLRAQRMEGVGALAGGLAHDLNNILAPILMSAPLLREVVHDPEAREMLNTVETCAQRGADIIKQLLTFARGKPGTRLPVPLRQLLREMDKLIAETFPRHLKRRLVAPADLWPVLGDPTQIHQALMNLCVNARDAMPQGGSLTLAAQNVELDEAFATMAPEAKPGPYVCLTVSDTGVGIPPENLGRIFDPFFTTKEIGKGTGLGLATVLGIVRGHGGFLRVQSRVGQGTTFELYFPASPDVQAQAAAAAMETSPRGNGELILVVDDEASVRAAVQRTLERHGYRVLLAVEGAEALALFAQHRAEVRAVLTDMMMPGMDGPSLVRALRHMAPHLPLIGMTGVAERLGDTEVERLALPSLLTKPFPGTALLTALARALTPQTTDSAKT